ncbi:hypothetical protein [Halostreptopolyspora alba]|uniref:DUF3558 domain-containing protein n=1 Tax=Halostreptopolyspora alba TaxID=2487137 RepID=A0A3N0E2Z5_9ACTN|nr:hypothetical protein EFW17_19820 [Nocardiopsaceae bacterium YIM 96095]
MRLTPPTIPTRCTAAAGAVLATTMLLAGCDSESVDDATSVDEDSWSDWFSFGDDGGEGGGSEQAEGDQAEGDQADGEQADGEQEEEWWDISDWFSSDDGDSGGGSEETGGEEDSGGEGDQEESEEEQLALPDSCADVGAQEVAGGLAPQGATLSEDAGEIDGAPDAAQLSCVWSGSGGSGSQSFALVFTENADPSARLDVAQASGEEEMNWEVDIDVNVENYRTAQADALGGDLDYVATVEGSTKSLHLSLPDDFHVSAIAVSSDTERAELEDVVLQAAERLRG